MYKRTVNPGCIQEEGYGWQYTAELGLRAFYLGRAVRVYLYKGERHGVMYTGDGTEKSGNQKAMPGKGLSN